ncbi:MAG: hypothetical protein ACFFAH_05005 [Promethearchaeota archaeon]
MIFPLYSKLINIAGEIIIGLEKWCMAFNNFAVIFFIYMKYIFVFILLSIGILTLLKFRGIYKTERLRGGKHDPKNENQLYKPRLMLGIFYIFMALGIAFNYLTYFLIRCLDPLPDRFIFDFINFSGRIDSKDLNRIEDINAAKYPHEKSIYYCIAMASFGAILDVVICIHSIVNNNGLNTKIIKMLIGGVITGMMTGWTTCLPLLL